MRIGGVPEPDAIRRDLQRQPRREVEIGADLLGGDLAVGVLQDRADLPARLVRRHRYGEVEAGAGHVRGDPRAAQVHGRHRLEPDGLPDPGRPGVVAAVVEVLRRLLAAGLRAVPAVPRADDNGCLLAGLGDLAEVGAERREPTAVPHHLDVVHPHGRVVVHRLEVQYGVLAGPVGRDRDGRPVPDGLHEVDVLDPGQLRLRRERHGDPLRELSLPDPALETGVRPVDLELPLAVQIHPLRTNELRARVLRTRLSHEHSRDVVSVGSARQYNVGMRPAMGLPGVGSKVRVGLGHPRSSGW